jgi:hypothetical protein
VTAVKQICYVLLLLQVQKDTNNIPTAAILHQCILYKATDAPT